MFYSKKQLFKENRVLAADFEKSSSFFTFPEKIEILLKIVSPLVKVILMGSKFATKRSIPGRKISNLLNLEF